MNTVWRSQGLHHGPATVIEEALSAADREQINALREQARTLRASQGRPMTRKAFYAINDEVRKIEDAIGTIQLRAWWNRAVEITEQGKAALAHSDTQQVTP